MSNVQHAVRQSGFAPGPLRSDAGSTGARRLPPASRIRGFLGVLVDSFDPRGSKGISVLGTFAGSAAARVGLAVGDTITSVDGIGLSSGASLGELISGSDPGEHVTVAWTTPQGTGHLACVRLSREPSKIRLATVTSRAA